MRRDSKPVLMLLAALVLLQGCTGLQARDPLQVFLVGVEPMEGAGMELRMRVKLRVQNPNDAPLQYDGVAVRMDVQGRAFATGVSDVAGSVPRFGESLVEVPVSIPLFRIAGQALALAMKQQGDKLGYELSGRLSGPGLRALRFRSKGEFSLPAETLRAAP